MHIARIAGIACLALPFAASAEGAIPVTCKSADAVAKVHEARNLLDNVRVAEATVVLEAAVKADPACPMAQALLTTLLPATSSGSHLKAALAHLDGLPAAERAQIELIAAGFNGDNAKARELTAQLVELAPGDWRAHNGLGGQALGDQDYDLAVRELSRAIELNPQAAGAYNNLGYSYAGQDRYDDAARIFRKYAEIAPAEPNAHDSLAEVLMNGGHLAESEGEFQKALALNPKFAGAWMGIAQTRLLRGDAAGADQALANERLVDPRPQARLGVDIAIAYALAAEGKSAAAYAQLDRVKAEATKLHLPQMYFVDAIQARLQMRDGHLKKAQQLAKASLESSRKAKVPGGLKRGLMQGTLIEVVRVQALLGNEDEAWKALSEFEEVVKPTAQNAFTASQLQNARGMAALARKDYAAAVEATSRCQRADFQCVYERARIHEAAGDKAGLEADREALLHTPRRGIEYVMLWKKLGGTPSVQAAN